jgi:prepilin-type N-terminal cleavage/methylation domain-containing protein
MKANGFSLVEVIVVISILGIFVSVVIPRLFGFAVWLKNEFVLLIGKQLRECTLFFC